jgi:hypothetical protein
VLTEGGIAFLPCADAGQALAGTWGHADLLMCFPAGEEDAAIEAPTCGNILDSALWA